LLPSKDRANKAARNLSGDPKRPDFSTLGTPLFCLPAQALPRDASRQCRFQDPEKKAGKPEETRMIPQLIQKIARLGLRAWPLSICEYTFIPFFAS